MLVNALRLLDSGNKYKALALGSSSDTEDDLNETVLLFLQITCIVEIILMTVLILISTSVLIHACKSKHKPASFIIKLLILVDCVAVSGLGAAMNEAPWLRHTAYSKTATGVFMQGVFEFVYWVTAQWSTWIIAFQFYSTAKQMKKVDSYFMKK